MPTAICKNGHLRNYANPRGTKLADFAPCACGSGWSQAVWDHDTDTYVPRVKRASSHKGRKMGKCPVCRKHRLLTLKREWTGWDVPAGKDRAEACVIALPDGVQPCWYHNTADVRAALEKST